VYASRPREVYLRRDVRDPHAVLLHELGHVYDLTVLSDRDRTPPKPPPEPTSEPEPTPTPR
jgi:hypothetical protein